MGFFDSPQISQMAFNARRCASGSSLVAGAVDGTVRVGEGRATRIGYRLFPQPTARASSVPVLLLIKFHGNSELAADYDRGICPMRQMLRSSAFRLALLVVDFRGFGWSDGSPALTKLPGDACDVMDALFATELPKHGLSDAVVVVHGRSIGSVCAARVASSPHSARLAGMIIESGLNVITELPMVKQLVKMMPKIAYVVPLLPDPFQQCKQMRAMPETLPLLVLHGEADQVCPAAHGQQLYDAAASRRKIIKRWGSGPRGHNDLGTHPAYHPLVLNFLERCVALAAALAKVGGAARGASERSRDRRDAREGAEGAPLCARRRRVAVRREERLRRAARRDIRVRDCAHWRRRSGCGGGGQRLGAFCAVGAAGAGPQRWRLFRDMRRRRRRVCAPRAELAFRRDAWRCRPCGCVHYHRHACRGPLGPKDSLLSACCGYCE